MCGRWKYPVLVFTAICGYLLLRFVVRFPFGISEGLSAMLFYLLGHFFRLYRHYYAGQPEKTQRWLHAGCAVLFVAAICCSYWGVRHSSVVMSAGYYGHHLINIIGTCGSTYVFYLFCKAAGQHLPHFSRLLCFAGYGSLFILWIHKLSLHFVFAWPFVWGCCPENINAGWAAAYFGIQLIFCLCCLMVANQSYTLRNFFGIYQPEQ